MNPEFQRNLYLEFSFARLVGMPAFLLVVFLLTYLTDDHTFSEDTANTALGLYIAIVLFWGAKQAAESIFDELRNNTWDIQKTSAISPWSLTWGKLFGSTLYNWYGGIICLLVYSIATPEPEYIMLTWVYALSCGVLVQALSLLVSIFSLRRMQNYNKGFSYLFGLFVLFSIFPIILNIDELYNEVLYWYGEQYIQTYFFALSLIIACIWTIIGIYRLLSEELRIRTLPWVWMIFIVFLIVYSTGIFVADGKDQQHSIVMTLVQVSFAVCIFLSYLLLFIDENSPMLLRKICIYSKQGQWIRMCQEIPCWFICLTLALPAMVLLTLLFPLETVDKDNLHPLAIYLLKICEANLYPIVIYLLMLRDIAILLFFSYSIKPKRALSLTLLYLICLYGLLPAIFLGMNVKSIAGLILPVLNNNPLLAILFASIQTSIIGFLLLQRWRKRVADVRKETIGYLE